MLAKRQMGHQASECWELSGCIFETETHGRLVSSEAEKAGGAYGKGIAGTDARQTHGEGKEQEKKQLSSTCVR